MARSPRPVRVLRRRTLYRGRIIRLVLEDLVVKGRRIQRETILHPGAAVIVPLLKDGRVILVRQYRRAVDQWLLELPAGTLDPGERPLSCARRELEEETGWRAKQMTRLARFYAAPGVTSEELTVYLARGLRKTTASPEPDESLCPVVLGFQQALTMVRRGVIRDAKTIIGLLAAERRLPNLKQGSHLCRLSRS